MHICIYVSPQTLHICGFQINTSLHTSVLIHDYKYYTSVFRKYTYLCIFIWTVDMLWLKNVWPFQIQIHLKSLHAYRRFGYWWSLPTSWDPDHARQNKLFWSQDSRAAKNKKTTHSLTSQEIIYCIRSLSMQRVNLHLIIPFLTLTLSWNCTEVLTLLSYSRNDHVMRD